MLGLGVGVGVLGGVDIVLPVPNRCDRICHPPQILFGSSAAWWPAASSPQGPPAQQVPLSSQSPLCTLPSNSIAFCCLFGFLLVF